MPTPETQALVETTRQQQPARPRLVVSASVALVSLLGLVLVLAGLSARALAGIAALVLAVAVTLGDRPGKRSA